MRPNAPRSRPTSETSSGSGCRTEPPHRKAPLTRYRIQQPAAQLWTYFTNETCRPTSNPREPCTPGYYGVYVITAQTYGHVKSGIDFARNNNLRLVIRNTGHDFLGRSTGWGALVINTRSFRGYTFHKTWDGPGTYKGPAATVGAGTQARDFLKLAHAQSPPQAVMTGECPVRGAPRYRRGLELIEVDCWALGRSCSGRRSWAVEHAERLGCGILSIPNVGEAQVNHRLQCPTTRSSSR